jgi:FtsH-binding integral membrane protein
MLDLAAYRAHAWKSWQVFVYAFVVYLMGILAIVLHGVLTEIGTTELFMSALLAAIAVAGLGYQEARELGSFRRAPRRDFADDEE